MVVAVDGDSLARRAHHGFERTGWVDPQGRPSWVVDGSLQMAHDMVARVQRFSAVAAAVVAFDDRSSSWRRDMFPGYKAGRTRPSQEYFDQLPRLRDAFEACGAEVVSVAGQEADDVVSSVATRASKGGLRTVVCTSDRDAFALVDHDVVVYRLGIRGRDAWMNVAQLRDRYGIGPGQYLDLAALRGDPSDALPGVPGFGDKRASQLLAAFGSVAEAFAAGEDGVAVVVGSRLAAALFASREDVERNLVLMSTARDLPVEWGGARPHRKVTATLGEAGCSVRAVRAGSSLAARLA